MILDVVVIAVLFVSAVIAFLRGFIREVLTIIGMLGATLAAIFGGPILSPFIFKLFGADEEAKFLNVLPHSMAADILAYGGIFVVVIFALSLVSHMVAESAKAMGLGPVDRTMGIGFGLLRGVFMLALLYLPFHILLGTEAKASWFESSKTQPYLEKAAGWMQAMIPEDMIEDMEKQAEEAEKAAQSKEKDIRQTLKDEVKPAITGYTEEFRNEMDRLFDEESPAAQEGDVKEEEPYGQL